MNKILTATIISLLFVPYVSQANQEDLISSQNKLAANIEKKVAAGDLSFIQIEWQIVTEGAPPTFKFYFELGKNQLIAAIVYTGHETWGNRFSYYFDPQENIIKYLKEIDADTTMGFDPKLKRQAIIYNQQNQIIWKNTGQPSVEPKVIKTLFKSILAASQGLSGY